MKVYQVTDKEFRKYGTVLKGYDFTELCAAMMEKTPLPDDVAYVPSVPELEACKIYKDFTDKAYGELPIQIGYCNGHNQLLNAVEYHRSSELDIAATDLILLLGMQQDINDDFTYDTANIEAFLLPAGVGVELYATTLHYAPCGVDGNGFRCVVVLPKDTNTELTVAHKDGEDKLITAKNKWLIGHKDGGFTGDEFIGLIGENISVK
jgi:hypothetical protein